MIQIITTNPALAEAIADFARHDTASAILKLLRSSYDIRGAVSEVCSMAELFRVIEAKQITDAEITYISHVMEDVEQ